jgi:superfamily II RNA helicase
MVKICPDIYPIVDEPKYSLYFEKYPFPLSSFQKFAIEAIVEGNHILVTAHTGSGKTLPAEFAIEYFVSQGKKVIYTAPIKALSNQKFYEFTQKFPTISFGIFTGDIKTNPEADVLIMTTEILMNTLYAKNRKDITSSSKSLFEMDFDNELACVIFDEIHYINDVDRGRVWEETIMMLPLHIQMVMLSATLDAPEKFALWCESRSYSDKSTPDKIVYLTTTYERVVPLTHYSFITCTQGIFKIIKDKQLEMEIMKNTNSLHIIQDSKGKFNDINYHKIDKTIDLFRDKDHHVKRQHVINTVAKHMVEHNMLPAICFVLSRKALEQCAKEINTNLLEDDSKIPYIIQRECEQIIRKLPNYHEYIQLPEYAFMVSLLEKGIAIHHAGIIPVLREMVELLFSKGYIKLLFATETFAVGINMPTKTVLFTDLNKFNGSEMRPLHSHEYTQMAGRAGRRGIDTIGHVIHLTNLFKHMDKITFKQIMKGNPQTLTSKFKISYNLLLNLIDIGETNYTTYAKKSMAQTDIELTTATHLDEITNITKEMLDKLSVLHAQKVPVETVEEYIYLRRKRDGTVNKKRKEIDKQLKLIEATYKPTDDILLAVSNYISNRDKLTKLKNQLVTIETSLETGVNKVLALLANGNYIEPYEDRYKLTSKGHIATHLRETPCLIFAELMETNELHKYTPVELVGILSCFTNISVHEDKKTYFPKSTNKAVEQAISNIDEMCRKHSNIEFANNIETGVEYAMQFDLVDYVMQWCDCNNDAECKLLLQQISFDKDIFLGEFIKAIFKINNIASEMETVAEQFGDMMFLSTLKQIPILTLKYVATNQSLYI